MRRHLQVSSRTLRWFPWLRVAGVPCISRSRQVASGEDRRVTGDGCNAGEGVLEGRGGLSSKVHQGAPRTPGYARAWQARLNEADADGLLLAALPTAKMLLSTFTFVTERQDPQGSWLHLDLRQRRCRCCCTTLDACFYVQMQLAGVLDASPRPTG